MQKAPLPMQGALCYIAQPLITLASLKKWLVSFGALSCSAGPHATAAAGPPPYLIAKVAASSHGRPILSPDVEDDDLMALIQGHLPQASSGIDPKRFAKLVEIYATVLSPPPVHAEEVNRWVENQLQQWYQKGMTGEAVQAHLGVDTLEEARQQLSEKYRKALACQRFIHQIAPYKVPTPAQVARFYARYLAASPPTVPAQVVLMEVACYPEEEDGKLEGPMTHLQAVYASLLQIKSLPARADAFLEVIAGSLTTSRYPTKYGLITSRQDAPQLTIAAVPQEIQDALLATGVTALTPHLVVPPHRFTDDHGHQGVRIVLVQACIPPHVLNLTQDYAYIATLWTQADRAASLKSWWDLHEKETVQYGLA